jgi:hypothetical protein
MVFQALLQSRLQTPSAVKGCVLITHQQQQQQSANSVLIGKPR